MLNKMLCKTAFNNLPFLGFLALLSGPFQIFSASPYDPPQTVYSIALKSAEREKTGKVTLGDPIRYFDHVVCNDLIAAPKDLLASLSPTIDTARIKWIVPIYVDDVLKSIAIISKYPGIAGYKNGAYNPPDDRGYAFAEIADAWPLSGGYHPLIIECDRFVLFHIPEAGDSNLTVVADNRGETDTLKIACKSQLQKAIIAQKATTKSNIHQVVVSFQNDQKQTPRNSPLAKEKTARSDFKTLSESSKSVQWLKTRKFGEGW